MASALNSHAGPGPGPFWGAPVKQVTRWLPARRIGHFTYPYRTPGKAEVGEWRLTERRAREQGHQPQSTWKLFGAGSVGGQALTGIPRVRALRHDLELAECSRVWPFETGFTPTPSPDVGPFVLHAEVFPNLVDWSAEEGCCNDEKQVKALVRWAADLDADGQMGPLFDSPTGLTAAHIRECEQEEGWILGLT